MSEQQAIEQPITAAPKKPGSGYARLRNRHRSLKGKTMLFSRQQKGVKGPGPHETRHHGERHMESLRPDRDREMHADTHMTSHDHTKKGSHKGRT